MNENMLPMDFLFKRVLGIIKRIIYWLEEDKTHLHKGPDYTLGMVTTLDALIYSHFRGYITMF
jgi:hypothetical protein